MQFLYKWVTKGHLSNLRKGMVEELEAFVADEQSLVKAHETAARVEAAQAADAEAQEKQEVTRTSDGDVA